MGNKVQTQPTGLEDFAGSWRLTRVIEDAYAGMRGELTGQARLTWAGDALLYEEQGELRYGAAAPIQATRRYRWEERSGTIAIFFDDGRYFHDLPLTGGSARHECEPDLYQVAYDFDAWPNWQAVWTVTGPRKDYLMTSSYALSSSGD